MRGFAAIPHIGHKENRDQYIVDTKNKERAPNPNLLIRHSYPMCARNSDPNNVISISQIHIQIIPTTIQCTIFTVHNEVKLLTICMDHNISPYVGAVNEITSRIDPWHSDKNFTIFQNVINQMVNITSINVKFNPLPSEITKRCSPRNRIQRQKP